MDTYTIVYHILQILVPILGIVLRCYQIRKERRKNDDTQAKSEPSVSIRVAHLGEVDVEISIHLSQN